jgi:predicted metal-dependent hydrolase
MSVEQFERGVDEFNRGYFFECHDTLEDLWHETRGNDRLFLQGLIQVSVGFYHFFNSNYKGATSQFTKGLGKLEQYRPSHRGIELEQFLRSVVGWLSMAERGKAGEAIEADETKVPKLQIIQRSLSKENNTWQQ